MSQRAVEQVLGKMVTDEQFREAFLVDPESATLQTGLALARHEVAALRRIPRKLLDAFAAQLDGRICRLCVAARLEPTESPR
jgi:hypothetical protein